MKRNRKEKLFVFGFFSSIMSMPLPRYYEIFHFYFINILYKYLYVWIRHVLPNKVRDKHESKNETNLVKFYPYHNLIVILFLFRGPITNIFFLLHRTLYIKCYQSVDKKNVTESQ